MGDKNHINGVITFTDSGALTAAYVAENMGLPYQCSYKAASILQDKSKFRQFLIENNFNCPHAKGYTNAKEALKDIDIFSWPVIVKPVDSAGSKGVKHNYSYFPIFIDAEKFGMTRDELYYAMKAEKVLARRYFYPLISEFSTYRGLESAKPENLPNAHKMADSVLCLPMHHQLEDGDLERILKYFKN